MQTAAILHAVLRDHDVSNNRLADLLGVDEKQVRKYLDGRAHFPAAALLVIPTGIVDDFLSRLRTRRGARGGVEQLRQALSALEREGAPGDVILEGVRRLSAVKTKEK